MIDDDNGELNFDEKDLKLLIPFTRLLFIGFITVLIGTLILQKRSDTFMFLSFLTGSLHLFLLFMKSVSD